MPITDLDEPCPPAVGAEHRERDVTDVTDRGTANSTDERNEHA